MQFSILGAFAGLLVHLQLTWALRFAQLNPNEGSKEDEKEHIPWDSSLNPVVDCEPGEKHSRFPGCICGQYARKVTREERMNMDQFDLDSLFFNKKGRKKKYYQCVWCSICPDGVIMTDHCRQAHDTQCDADFKCQNPDHEFDQGIKACKRLEKTDRPIPKTPAGVEPKLSTINSTSSDEGQKRATSRGSQKSVSNHHVVVIVTVVAITMAIVLLVEFGLFVCYLCKKNRVSRPWLQ